MRIACLLSGWQVPSSRFRVLAYLPGLRRRGHTCDVFVSRPAKYRGWPLIGNRLSGVPRRLFRLADLLRVGARRYDVLWLERELFAGATDTAYEAAFRRVSPRLVLDVDDGLHVQSPQKFAALCGLADTVLAGNELLVDAAGPHCGDVRLLPTVVDTDRVVAREAAADTGRLAVGWTGTAGNLRYLEPLLPVLRSLRQRHDFELRLIAEDFRASSTWDLGDVSLSMRKWGPASELADLATLDIGLMPLPDEPWERYKCGLKVLQYQAAGIPCVASPVGVNATLIRDGQTGLLASRPEEWEAALERLLSGPALRQALARAGREFVVDEYSVARWLPRLEAGLAGD